MSRFTFLILVYFITALTSAIGFADAAEEAEEKDSAGYEEFVGVDTSKMSKEELIPLLEGIELPDDGPLKISVVPIKTDIGKPSVFLLRRAVKEALENEADVLLLDMDTPGGGVAEALEMMEILNKFPGITMTYVNDEAISAGAIISSVTDHIYFSEHAIMGAAGAIQSTGAEIPETYQAKLYSYLDARIESYSLNKRLRNKVLKAMVDKDFELVEDNILIIEKDKLLSLTGPKAIRPFGDPAESLLAAGIAETIEDIFEYGFGTTNFEVTEFESTWSEDIAAILVRATPLLFGLGFAMLVIEIKTPSFGLLGGLGVVFVVAAFFGQDVAGLAGFEAILLLLVGVVLLAVEVFVIPGTLIFGFTGVLCILGAMVWSFADVWPVVPEPGEVPVDWTLNTESLENGIINLALSLLIAVAGLWAIWRFLPNSWLLKRVVVEGSSADPNPVISGGGRYVESDSLPDIGTEGYVMSDLKPTGLVKIGGERFEATTSVGDVRKGDKVIVVGYKSYSLLGEIKNVG